MSDAERQPTPIMFEPPPFAFDRAEALKYTRLAPKRFEQLERSGAIVGQPHGRGGKVLYLRTQLEHTMITLFGAGGAPARNLDDEI